MQREIAIALTLAFATTGAGVATGQTYPAKQVRLIVPFAAGGVTDIVGRLSAEFIGKKLGQTLVVENIGGAGGNLGVSNMIKAGADGHTLALVPTGNLAINPHIFSSMPFDALKDVTTVGLIAQSPQLLVVTPTVPAKTLRELIAHGKANPGKLNYGSAGVGSTNHLAADQLARAAGIDMVHVAYRGAAPAVTDLVGGHVQVMVVAASLVVEQVAAGTLRSLGAATENRSAIMPEIPTIAEEGLPGYSSMTWFAIVAPAGTPAPIVERLHGYLREMVADAEVLARFKSAYLEPFSKPLAELAPFVQAEHARWAAIVKDAGVKPQ